MPQQCTQILSIVLPVAHVGVDWGNFATDWLIGDDYLCILVSCHRRRHRQNDRHVGRGLFTSNGATKWSDVCVAPKKFTVWKLLMLHRSKPR